MTFESCDGFLAKIGVHIPLSLLPMICEQAAQDFSNDSLLLQNVCCQNINTTTPAVHMEYVHQLATTSCDNINITDPIRREFCTLAHEISGYDENSKTIRFICILLLCVLGPIGLISNTMIMFLVARCRRLRTTSGYFACNLATADLFYIFGTCIYFIINLQFPKVADNLHTYYVFSSFDVMMGSASLLCVMLVTLNRLVAVTRPLTYQGILSKRSAVRIIISMWAYCCVLFVVFLVRSCIESTKYGEVSFFFAVATNFFMPSIFIIASYAKISFVAFKNAKTDRKVFKTALAIHLVSIHKDKARKALLIKPARELKIALNLAITTLPLLVGWGYYMIASCIEIITKNVEKGTTNFVLNALPFIVCCLNPITYIMLTRALRKELYKTLVTKSSTSFAPTSYRSSVNENLL